VRLECPLCAESGLTYGSKSSLFDHLVGERKDRFGDGQPERLRGLEIDRRDLDLMRCPLLTLRGHGRSTYFGLNLFHKACAD